MQQLQTENSCVSNSSASDLLKHKYTVSHSSVAVNTSPTLNHVDKTQNLSNQVKVCHDLASVSPSTASSCSSIPTTTVMTMQQCTNGGTGNGSLTRYSQHLGKKN